MKIEGKLVASKIIEQLKQKIKRASHPPHLVVILIGDDLSSQKYVSRKLILGEKLGVKVTLHHFDKVIPSNLFKLVNSLNRDKEVHGIIIQRPVPFKIDAEELNNLVYPEKDVDGFNPQSHFDPPIALAVKEILKSVYSNHPPGVHAHPGGGSNRQI